MEMQKGKSHCPVLASKQTCTGCTACAMVCPRSAVSMRMNFWGFRHPIVDSRKCIGCGLCERTCPVLHPFSATRNPRCYIARSKDEQLLRNSTSGGMFTELACSVFSRGGCVFGCVLDAKGHCAYHAKAESLDEARAMRGSKYVQSDMRTVLRDVKKEVGAGRQVMFVGTPCQVAAVRKYVGDAENLLAVDLVCHGVPSPQLFDSYLNRLERARHAAVTNVSFRLKNPSWKASMFAIEFSDVTKNFCESLTTNAYGNVFAGVEGVGAVACRDSCYRCRHRAGASGADITIGDFWGVEDVARWSDDDKGASVVLVQTVKGQQAFDELKGRIEFLSVSFRAATIKNQNYLISSRHSPAFLFFRLVLKFLGPETMLRIAWFCRLPRRLARRFLSVKLRQSIVRIFHRGVSR